jgi:hypothetical protein
MCSELSRTCRREQNNLGLGSWEESVPPEKCKNYLYHIRDFVKVLPGPSCSSLSYTSGPRTPLQCCPPLCDPLHLHVSVDGNGGWTTFMFHGDELTEHTYHCICDPEGKVECDPDAVRGVMGSEDPISHGALESFSTFYSRIVFGRLGRSLDNGTPHNLPLHSSQPE